MEKRVFMIFWEDIDPKGIRAKCEYSDGIYTITVAKDETKLTETFGQTFTPTFGMDVDDKRQY